MVYQSHQNYRFYIYYKMQDEFWDVILLKNENKNPTWIIYKIIRQDRQKAIRHGLIYLLKDVYMSFYWSTWWLFVFLRRDLIDKLLYINTVVTLCSTRECCFHSALQACEQQQFDLMRTSLHTGANLNWLQVKTKLIIKYDSLQTDQGQTMSLTQTWMHI